MQEAGKKGFESGVDCGRAHRIEKRNGFELGDAVRLPNLEIVFEVVDLEDPSLIGLRAPSGRLVRAGWRVLSKVKRR